MADSLKPLQHQDFEKKDDDALRQEAHAYLSKYPALQVLGELLTELRERNLPWWTPDQLRHSWSSTERMRWYRERGDLRQQITTQLTGLAPKAARKKSPDFQASLLDSVIDDGDTTARDFEATYDPRDLVVYGPAGDFWRLFRERMPWDQDTPAHQEIVVFVLKSLLADKSFDGIVRKPLLSAWELRTAIASKVWHTRMPLDVRVAIDDARFEREKNDGKEPFHAKDDLTIALPEIIATNIPLRELSRVLEIAEKAMGFESVADFKARTADLNGVKDDSTKASDAAAKESAKDTSPPPAEESKEKKKDKGDKKLDASTKSAGISDKASEILKRVSDYPKADKDKKDKDASRSGEFSALSKLDASGVVNLPPLPPGFSGDPSADDFVPVDDDFGIEVDGDQTNPHLIFSK